MPLKILAVIPARGGSKSIPRKNIQPLYGRPLIGWKIMAARESGAFDRIIVSTDDGEIAGIAEKYGAEVPFLRPPELAEDATPALPVLQHAVRFLVERQSYHPDAVMLLEPTSPGVRPIHFREAADLLMATGSDSVVSVMEVPACFNPHWIFRMDDTRRMALFLGGPIKSRIKRRQDLPPGYSPNGGIYLLRPKFLFDPDEPNLYGHHVVGYVMDAKYSIDIDTPNDWVAAEEKMKKILQERSGESTNYA